MFWAYTGFVSARAADLADCLFGIEAKQLSQCQEFDDIDPALPAFKPRDKGLIFSELFRQFCLRELRLLPFADEERNQRFMPCHSEGLVHSTSHVARNAGLILGGKTDRFPQLELPTTVQHQLPCKPPETRRHRAFVPPAQTLKQMFGAARAFCPARLASSPRLFEPQRATRLSGNRGRSVLRSKKRQCVDQRLDRTWLLNTPN